jgi:DNA-binding NarL/FixJ family response regulator
VTAVTIPPLDHDQIAELVEKLRQADVGSPAGAPVTLGEHFIAAARVPMRHRKSLSELTPMELTVLRFLGWGRSNGDIAMLLLISENTVRVHLANICRKLELDGMRELSALAGVLFYSTD